MLFPIAPAQHETRHAIGAASSARSTAPTYARHATQRTLLYALVQAHYRPAPRAPQGMAV